MGRGRPSLRIGTHGVIRRTEVSEGHWRVLTWYRDADGEPRRVTATTPDGVEDRYGDKAVTALLDKLATRQPPSGGELTADTRLGDLLDWHITRIEAEDALSPKTVDTYRYAVKHARPHLGAIRVGEATPRTLTDALAAIQRAHGDTRARQVRVLLNTVLTDAVLAGVITQNPVLQLPKMKRTKKPAGGAPAVDMVTMARIYRRVTSSAYCRRKDLRDVVLVLMGTGARISEVLGLRWSDVDLVESTITFSGRVTTAVGKGTERLPGLKNGDAERTVAVPRFLVDALTQRPHDNAVKVFPSAVGTWRDPNNTARLWREWRGSLGLDIEAVSSHSWRKTAATVIDDAGLSARVAADQLGHTKVSMTQDVYMARKRVHTAVADALQGVIVGR